MIDLSQNESLIQRFRVNIAGKEFGMLMPFSKQFERGILKLSDDATSTRKPDYYEDPDFEGSIWEFQDGKWTKNPTS